MSAPGEGSNVLSDRGLAWHVQGAGDPILFLHGIPDSGRAWNGVMARLARHYRGLAPDLPGFGKSAPPERLAGMADIRAIMDHIVATLALPQRLTLVVHDAGGLFGLAWAAAHPERVHRLVVLNTSIFPDRRWHWGARILRTPALGELIVRFMPRSAFHAEIRRASNGNLSNAAIDETLAAFGPTARRTTLRLYRLQTPALLSGLPDAVPALTARVPTCVIWGGRDPYLPGSFAERFAAGDIRHHGDLGHWPHREAPERVTNEIHAFLLQSDRSGFRAQ